MFSPPRKSNPSPLAISRSLPLHLVGLVTLAQAERAREVASEQVDLLDVGNQRLVHSLLIRRSASADLLLL
jgi:hypothetical protein